MTISCSGKIVDDLSQYNDWLVLTTTPVILRAYSSDLQKSREKLRRQLLIELGLDTELNKRKNCFITKSG